MQHYCLPVKIDVGVCGAPPMVLPPAAVSAAVSACRELKAARERLLAMYDVHNCCHCLVGARQQAGRHYRHAVDDFNMGRDYADSLAAFDLAHRDFYAAADHAAAVASVLAQIALERRNLAAAIALLTRMAPPEVALQ